MVKWWSSSGRHSGDFAPTDLGAADSMMASIGQELLDECSRQIVQEGYSLADDDRYARGQLATAGAAYAFAGSVSAEMRSWLILSEKTPRPPAGSHVATIVRQLWPWVIDAWKPKDARRDLVRAGALIMKEIARRDRAAARERVQRPSETGL